MTLQGHVNACCVIYHLCLMCMSSHLHGRSQNKDDGGGQGTITLRSFHTYKKKKKLKLSLLLEAVSNKCFLLDVDKSISRGTNRHMESMKRERRSFSFICSKN